MILFDGSKTLMHNKKTNIGNHDTDRLLLVEAWIMKAIKVIITTDIG